MTLHPLRPPSLLAVEPPEHTRLPQDGVVGVHPASVAALRDRVEETANSLLDELAGDSGEVDIVERYCSQLPVAIISDILGVPESDRARVLEFGELAAPSLDVGLHLGAIPQGAARAGRFQRVAGPRTWTRLRRNAG